MYYVFVAVNCVTGNPINRAGGLSPPHLERRYSADCQLNYYSSLLRVDPFTISNGVIASAHGGAELATLAPNCCRE